MKRRRLLVALLAGLAVAIAAPTFASSAPEPVVPVPQQLTKRVRVKVTTRVRKHVLVRFHSHRYDGYATTYSNGGCDPTGGGSTTSWNTPVGFGVVANDQLPLGTWIEFDHPFHGRRDFRVEDHFGSGQPVEHLDVWVPCEWVTSFSVPYRVFWNAWRWRWQVTTKYIWKVIPVAHTI